MKLILSLLPYALQGCVISKTLVAAECVVGEFKREREMGGYYVVCEYQRGRQVFDDLPVGCVE